MSSKRGYLNVDPDYEDVSEQQNKKQRLIEKDAKAETIQKIEKIIQKQITIEIKEKENELNIIDQSIYQTRHLLDRLRACLVANYYSNDSIGTLPQRPYSSAVPSIHPAVKKYLGKKPSYSNEQWLEKNQWQGTSDSSTGLQSTNSSGNCSQSSVTVVESGDELGQRKSDSLTKLEPDVGSGRASRFRVKKKLIVGNISKFIPPDRREESDPSTHKWLIYVRGTKEEPNINHFVKRVWFFLHPSYRPNDLVEVVHPPFHLSRRGWGEFPVRVQLHFHDQRNKRVDIIHHLKLDRTYTGLQTFGAETTVEIEIEKGKPSENESAVAASTSSNVSCATKTQVPDEGTQSQDSGLNSNDVTTSSPSEILSPVNPEVATEKENTTVSELKKELVLDSSSVRNGVLPSDTTKSPSKLKVYKLTVGGSSSTANEVPLCLLQENSESFSLGNSATPPLTPSAVSCSDAKVTCTAVTTPVTTAAAAASVMSITAASPVITITGAPETTITSSPATALTTTTTTATSFTTITPTPVASITPVSLTTPTATAATNLTKPVISCNTSLPYFVTLTSLPSSKLSIPLSVSKQKFAAAAVSTTTAASSTSIVGSTATTVTITTAASVLPTTAILAPKPANLQAAPVPMKVQNLQNLPLNTLLKCLNSQGKVLLMSQPLVGKTTPCLPASALVSSQTNTPSSVSATVTSLLHSNSTSVATTTTSSIKPPITISKPFLTDDAIKKVPNSSTTKTYTIQLGSASNLPEVSGQNDSVVKDKANAKKENTPVISPFRVTPKGLISIPNSTVGVCWSSPVTVQSSLSQIKPNPVASHALLSMGSLPQTNVLPTSLVSLSAKVPTTTNTSVILLSSSPVNKNTSLLAASSPAKKTITQPGIFIPTVSPGVVRPLVSEIKSTPGKSSLLLLSSTASGLNKGPIVTGNKILQSSPSLMNSVSVSNTSGTTTPVQPFILSSNNSSIIPAATRLPLMSPSPPVINVGMQNVKTLARSGDWRQPVRCNLVTSSSTLQTLPSTFSTGKQTYVLTTTRNKGLSLLPSHLFLKPSTETKPDTCQSLLTKASTSNMNTTQPVLSGIGSTPNTVSTTSSTLLNTPRPMLLLKNPNKTAMIVTPVNNSTMPTGRIWPSASVAEKPASSNVTSSSQDGSGTNVSLQVQYSNGNLVLAPPSGFSNNSLSQKVLLKVIPSTSTCNSSSVSSLSKSSNGTVSLSTVTTTVISTAFPKTTSVITKQVRPTVCEKKIHGYSKVKKIQPVNLSVPSINLNSLTDMMSVIRAVVRLHPLVSEGVDRSLHPYATDTVDQWLSWNIGKRRASEWQRASSVKNYILKLLSGSGPTNFSAADVWSTKQIFTWCRLHAYTPHHLENQLQGSQLSCKSFSETSCTLQPLSSFTPMETIEKRLEQLEDSGQSLCNENFLTVDVISRGLPKVKIKKEVDTDPVTSTDDYIYLPSPDASNFVHETARQVGVQFKPTKIEDNIYSPSCELMIYSCMENIMSDILRTAFALKSKEGRYPTELSLQDIHKALTSIPACDFLTNSNLGLVVDSDHIQPSVDHNKEKHGIT